MNIDIMDLEELDLSKIDFKKITFEEAINLLENIVRKLESSKEKLTLKASINNYELGTALIEYCENELKSAKLKVNQIMQKKDGSIELEDKLNLVDIG